MIENLINLQSEMQIERDNIINERNVTFISLFSRFIKLNEKNKINEKISQNVNLGNICPLDNKCPQNITRMYKLTKGICRTCNMNNHPFFKTYNINPCFVFSNSVPCYECLKNTHLLSKDDLYNNYDMNYDYIEIDKQECPEFEICILTKQNDFVKQKMKNIDFVIHLFNDIYIKKQLKYIAINSHLKNKSNDVIQKEINDESNKDTYDFYCIQTEINKYKKDKKKLKHILNKNLKKMKI